MRVLAVGRVNPIRGWGIREHVHPENDELIVVMQGRLETRIGRGAKRVIAGGPGEALFYPKGEPHEEQALGKGMFESYHVGWISDDARVRDWPLVLRDRTGRVGQAIRWMYDLSRTPGAAAEETINALMRAIVHELSTGPRTAENEMVVRVQAHVEQHLTEPLELDDLAAVAGMSKFHFSRVFTAATSITPMAYVRDARLRTARTLLQTTPLPLRTIAEMAGFSDQPQFSRVFKRVVGEAPGAFRQRASARSS